MFVVTGLNSNPFSLSQPRNALRASRHLSPFAPRMATGMWAMGFTFCCAISTLFSVSGFGPIYLLSFFGFTGLFILCYPHLALRANSRNALFWLYPAWLLMSAGWSNIPDRTTHSVLLVVPTFLAGITLGGISDRRAVNIGAAIAAALYITYSVAFSSTTGFSDTGSGGIALTGFGNGKNFYGHLSAVSLLLAPSLFSYARTQYGRLAVIVGLFSIIVSSYALIGSHATGSLLASIIGCATYPAVLLFRRIAWQWRIVLISATAGILILYLAFGEDLKDIIFQTVLAKFNKDTSLTGRTTLWDFADRLIAQHRILGYGYGSFWQTSNPDAWTVWRMMGVAPNSGFNFHNTFRETLIDGGLVGLVIYLGTFGFAFVRTALRSLRTGELIDAVRLSFIVYFVVRMPVESTGIGGPSLDSIMLLAFLSVPVPTKAAAISTEQAEPRFRTRPRSVALRPSVQLR
jgi:exopolysaccharide production protein ExoQ